MATFQFLNSLTYKNHSGVNVSVDPQSSESNIDITDLSVLNLEFSFLKEIEGSDLPLSELKRFLRVTYQKDDIHLNITENSDDFFVACTVNVENPEDKSDLLIFLPEFSISGRTKAIRKRSISASLTIATDPDFHLLDVGTFLPIFIFFDDYSGKELNILEIPAPKEGSCTLHSEKYGIILYSNNEKFLLTSSILKEKMGTLIEDAFYNQGETALTLNLRFDSKSDRYDIKFIIFGFWWVQQDALYLMRWHTGRLLETLEVQVHFVNVDKAIIEMDGQSTEYKVDELGTVQFTKNSTLSFKLTKGDHTYTEKSICYTLPAAYIRQKQVLQGAIVPDEKYWESLYFLNENKEGIKGKLRKDLIKVEASKHSVIRYINFSSLYVAAEQYSILIDNYSQHKSFDSVDYEIYVSKDGQVDFSLDRYEKIPLSSADTKSTPYTGSDQFFEYGDQSHQFRLKLTYIETVGSQTITFITYVNFGVFFVLLSTAKLLNSDEAGSNPSPATDLTKESFIFKDVAKIENYQLQLLISLGIVSWLVHTKIFYFNTETADLVVYDKIFTPLLSTRTGPSFTEGVLSHTGLQFSNWYAFNNSDHLYNSKRVADFHMQLISFSEMKFIVVSDSEEVPEELSYQQIIDEVSKKGPVVDVNFSVARF